MLLGALKVCSLRLNGQGFRIDVKSFAMSQNPACLGQQGDEERTHVDTHTHAQAMTLGSGGVLLILPLPGPWSLSMLIRYSTGGGVTSLGMKSLEEQSQAVTSPTPQEQEATVDHLRSY